MNRENEIMEVRVDEIIPNRFQPRLAFNQTELKELSDSIKVHGIIQPLVLRRIGDKFEIIAGERRHKAAMMAGLQTVPAIIMNMDDKQSAEVAVVENLQRKDLTAIEEAKSYNKLLNMGYTQEELAAKMGVAQPTIANKLRLLNLPEEVQQALLKNQISERHARSLLAIPETSLQVSMLQRIINERLTVRQTDDEISKILGRAVNPVSPNPLETSDETGTSPIGPNTFNSVQNNSNEPRPFAGIEESEQNTRDIDMLLRPETNIPRGTDNQSNLNGNSTETVSPNMERLVNPNRPAINPFQEIDTEIMNFEIPSKLESPTVSSQPETPRNSLIEEFRQQNGTSYQAAPVQNINTPTEKSISSAINVARNEVRKIEDLGFEVDTEEFDFEDMYQIIIKIKKD